ncbi:WXG100 family type VII secretion target [Antrihabitans cavernicola]|nr:WXG100 family type VII secretion target [Spelaeibacter cavernicola]
MRGNPHQIHATADRTAALSDDFWNDVETLRRDAEQLMQSDWTGDAANTHAALWAEWVDSARQVTTALSNDAGLLHQAADSYTATDDGSADAISDIRLDM